VSVLHSWAAHCSPQRPATTSGKGLPARLFTFTR
jgi:hypothetical protein